MFKIGYRTLKTAVGAALSVLIAQSAGLDFYASAGIITILCIQKTKRKSVQTSTARLLACLIGMVYAVTIFELIGYHPLSLAVLLLVFIPTTLLLNLQGGIVTSSVINFHIYTVGEISPGLIINELALVVIGIGIALIVNMYMPSKENELENMQEQLEKYYVRIFHEFASYIREGDSTWDGREITEAASLLEASKNQAMLNLENHILRYEDLFYHYFKMREKQLDIIERLMPLLTSIGHHVEQADMLAEFMDELADGVNSRNTAHIYIRKLDELKASFKEMPLPDTREEFEARSSLRQVVRELDQYLIIKQQFKPVKSYSVFR